MAPKLQTKNKNLLVYADIKYSTKKMVPNIKRVKKGKLNAKDNILQSRVF